MSISRECGQTLTAAVWRNSLCGVHSFAVVPISTCSRQPDSTVQCHVCNIIVCHILCVAVCVQALALVGGDQAHRLIPMVTISLNPRVCMCQSMQEIANVIGFPIPIPFVSVDTSCSPRLDCTGILCNVTIGTIGRYAVDVTIDPCGESVRLTGRDLSENGGQFERVFRDSGSYPFSISDSLHATLLIGMVHHNYSMDLSVSALHDCAFALTSVCSDSLQFLWS